MLVQPSHTESLIVLLPRCRPRDACNIVNTGTSGSAAFETNADVPHVDVDQRYRHL